MIPAINPEVVRSARRFRVVHGAMPRFSRTQAAQQGNVVYDSPSSNAFFDRINHHSPGKARGTFFDGLGHP
jgi:hypothetical protein